MNEAILPVLVTTEHRGVFFGYVHPGVDLDVESIRIERARMAVFWPADVHGVLGLAANGPTAGCRIGPPAPAITLQGVTSIAEVSAKAVERWESAPWSR